jgi:hypothetical protein
MGSHSPGVSRCGILPGLSGVTEMNERINEFIKQSYVTVQSPSGEGYTHFSQEKFAQLIVKECAQVCLAQRDPANLNYKPSEKFAEAVKQHFGVEE